MIPAKNRERKCSTCKHYQPSPLWRKGWCRNPLLYDRNTNHLVEADSLACNRTFIDYWEPTEGPTNGPQPRGTKPRIAPSIPMDTKDAQGRAGVVTGNTPAVGMPAVNARTLYRPTSNRGRPSLSLVTPEFDEEGDELDPARETVQIDEVVATKPHPTARQRIQHARASKRLTLFGLSGPSLWLPLGIVAALLLLGGFAVLSNNQRVGGGVPATATVTNPPPSPTGFGEPTATTQLQASPSAPVVPSDVIAVGGWVQVQSSNGLIVRAEPGTSARRVTTMPNGAKARVIGGPETANGFTWWKVTGFSTSDPELEGWCAESFLGPTTAP